MFISSQFSEALDSMDPIIMLGDVLPFSLYPPITAISPKSLSITGDRDFCVGTVLYCSLRPLVDIVVDLCAPAVPLLY